MIRTLVLSVLLAAVPAAAQRVVAPLNYGAPTGIVTVVGVGRTDAVPNIARLTLSFSDQKLLAAPVPLASVAPEVRAADLAVLRQQHALRVLPALQAARALVSDKPRTQARDVKASQSAQQVTEYVTVGERNEQHFSGQQITTTIELTLRGTRKQIEEKLGRFFDSAAIRPDAQSDPVYDLSHARRRSAERGALKRAMRDARSQAVAQLQPGEKLGRAIERGEAAAPGSAPRFAKSAMRSAAVMTESVDSGSGIASVGTEEIVKNTRVVFEVNGPTSTRKYIAVR